MDRGTKAEKPFSFSLLAKFAKRFKEYFKEVIHTGSAMVAIILVGLMAIGAVVLKAVEIME